MRELYPSIEPYDSGRLQVSPIHNIYYEQAGNPEGQPVVFLHGGPGGGIVSDYRRYFDPAAYRVVLFDQRGSGQSTPHAELEGNTTWDLVEDIEQLRTRLGVESWHVFGGSWGSTLALAYSETHPERVRSLTLRGIFLCRPKEIRWFYQEGANWIFPDVWEEYLNAIPEAERGPYTAVAHPAVSAALTSRGVPAIELLPVLEIADAPVLVRRGRSPSGGDATLTCVAPAGRSAPARDSGEQVREYVYSI
jgi:proline iminopeptidase